MLHHMRSSAVILLITELSTRKWDQYRLPKSNIAPWQRPFLLALFPFCAGRVSEISAIVVCAARVECELRKPGGFRPPPSGVSAREPHCRESWFCIRQQG